MVDPRCLISVTHRAIGVVGPRPKPVLAIAIYYGVGQGVQPTLNFSCMVAAKFSLRWTLHALSSAYTELEARSKP